MALSSECEVHNWSWSTEDDMGCPVCYGIELGEQRIIKLIEDNLEYIDHEGLALGRKILRVESLIAFINSEGECQKDNETVVLLTEEAEAQRVALAWERERFDRLWQIEMDVCKCEEAMQHLKVRMGRTENGIDYDAEFGDN